VDVGALLREVLERECWSLSELAARAGTSRATLGAYLSGRVSPTVRTLDRLVAAGGLQTRVTLEPLWEDLDAQVDALLAGHASVDVDGIRRIVARAELEQRWGAEDPVTGQVTRRAGHVRWALDGATALRLHGLSCAHSLMSVVMVFDDAARAWLTSGLMRPSAPGGALGWWSCELEQARHACREVVVGAHGLLELRLVAELPHVVEIRLPGTADLVPVVSVDEVERTNAQLGAVLARLRLRRAAQGRT
jgi:transcriptional regulator with XRE-family HTH domain